MKTTKKDFELFESECLRWLEIFGLNEWDNEFRHEKIDDDAFAQVVHYNESRLAVFSMSTDKTHESDDDIRHNALHEALEALLANLDTMARERKWDEEAWTAERHAVINRIMNVLKKRD